MEVFLVYLLTLYQQKISQIMLLITSDIIFYLMQAWRCKENNTVYNIQSLHRICAIDKDTNTC